MDPRQRRSRDRLHRAVLELAAEQPVEGLTMTAVARAAGVHRSTLHDHANSPMDLLQAALGAELDDLREGLPAPGSSADEVARAVSDVTRGVLEHVRRHLAVYRVGLGDEATVSLRPMLSRHFLESSRMLRAASGVDIEVEVSGVDHERVVDAAQRFIADGTVGVIAGWVARPDLDVDELLATYEGLLPTWWPRDAAL